MTSYEVSIVIIFQICTCHVVFVEKLSNAFQSSDTSGKVTRYELSTVIGSRVIYVL